MLPMVSRADEYGLLLANHHMREKYSMLWNSAVSSLLDNRRETQNSYSNSFDIAQHTTLPMVHAGENDLNHHMREQYSMLWNSAVSSLPDNRREAQNSYSNSFDIAQNTTPPMVPADGNDLNHHMREQYSMLWNSASQLNGTASDMTNPEAVGSYDPQGGMYAFTGHFATSAPLHYGPRMQSLDRNITGLYETASNSMLSDSFTQRASSPVTQISGNAHNTVVMTTMTVARALESEAPVAQSGPPYEAVKGGYRCCTCDKVIKRKNDMDRHLMTTVRHGGKRLECPVCGRFYTRPSTLREHVCVET